MLQKFKQDFPRFKNLFQFGQFNEVQKSCYSKIFQFDGNMIVSAPTSSGKTVLFQLLIAKMMNQSKTKCLYLAPIKSLCHQKANDWRKKFRTNMSIMELTGDTLEMQASQFDSADIYVATPQKIDYISRKNLNFLKQLNLLLIDQIHMLNMEGRGAILEAIVSRIMSINKNIRIMAVSATIPNIKEVAQWLKVPSHLICVFGDQYRPSKLHKIVLGFKSANNDFNFEKTLNFKILDVIRQYSCGRGTLIFCQTQKGTEQACIKIVSQSKEREFTSNQRQYFDLVNSAKMVDNSSLKQLLPQGLAFHNAGLSMKDRSIVQGLFLEMKVKVLCTTSTLAMGINLPARLVVIKSTKCYKGAGKGYQQYTQIELDQMMGRAGRIPYDKQGTVVIMTQKSNYNKYIGQNKLQPLQSQLYYQFIDHLNTQISLKSIQTLSEAVFYLKNSFCYIRMLKSPKTYNLSSQNDVQKFVNQTCVKCVNKLSEYEIIHYISSNQKIYPRQCSNNISKNAIQVETIIRAIQELNSDKIIQSERQFIQLLCKANQLSKYRSKLDQRKYLKQLNEKNRYTLKEAISNSQKKCFVLLQAQLTGLRIDNWELRRQSSQAVYFYKRLAYCIKSVALQRRNSHKTFWMYLFGCLFWKYFAHGFWESNQERVLKQIKKVSSKWKNISARGIKSLSELIYGLNKLDIFGNSISSTSIKKDIQQQLFVLNGSLQMNLKKSQQSYCQKSFEDVKQKNKENDKTSNQKQTNHLLRFIFTKNFTPEFKSINFIVELNSSIYHTGYLNAQNLEFTVFLKNTTVNKYFIAIIKDGYIGFDQFYWCQKGALRKTQLKRQQYNKKMAKCESADTLQLNRKSQSIHNSFQNVKQRKRKSSSHQSLIKSKLPHQKNKKLPRKIIYNGKQKDMSFKKINQRDENQFKQESHEFQQNTWPSTTKINKKSKQLKLTQNFSTIKRKYIYDETLEEKQKQQNPLKKQLKKPFPKETGFRDLKSYNWKAGFEQIKSDYQNETLLKDQKNELLLIDQKNESLLIDQKNERLLIDQKNEKTNEQTNDTMKVISSQKHNQFLSKQYQSFNNKLATNKKLPFQLPSSTSITKDQNIKDQFNNYMKQRYKEPTNKKINPKVNIINESNYPDSNVNARDSFYKNNESERQLKQRSARSNNSIELVRNNNCNKLNLRQSSFNNFNNGFQKKLMLTDSSQEDNQERVNYFQDIQDTVVFPKKQQKPLKGQANRDQQSDKERFFQSSFNQSNSKFPSLSSNRSISFYSGRNQQANQIKDSQKIKSNEDFKFGNLNQQKKRNKISNQRNKSKKLSFKNAFQYFQSFLTDDEEEY